MRFRLYPIMILALAITPGIRAQEAERLELTIDQAVNLALSDSKTIGIKRIAVDKSRSELRETQARRGPSIQLQGSGSYLSNPPEGITISKGSLGYAPTAQSEVPVALPDQDIVLAGDTEHTYFTLKTTLTQPIFTWGKLATAEKLSRLNTDVAAHELTVEIDDAESQVKTLYLGGRLGQESVPALERIVGIGEQILEDRQLAFDEGLITRQNVLEAQSRLAGLEFQLQQSREGARTATEALLYTIGKGDRTGSTIEYATGFRDELPEIDEIELVRMTVEHSPDLALLETRLEQSRLAVDLARASQLFLPDFSLSVTLDITGQRIPIIGANWTESWNANLIVSIGTQVNLFDSGKAGAGIAQARYDMAMAATGVDAFTDSVGIQVRRAVELVRTSYYEMQYAKAKLDLAAEQAKNATVSYENEIVTREEYLGGQLALAAAEIELIVKAYSFDSALVSLEALTGHRF